MGKQSGKKKKQLLGGAYDNDTLVFISMSNELKDKGNKLFHSKDYEGAMLKYDKAIKLLPRNHIDVSNLHSNIAACYMQMGLSEYSNAIHQCNLALEVTPKYSKALLKRARCYEALNKLDLAVKDINMVLKMEPNNLMAIEVAERVTKLIESTATTSPLVIHKKPSEKKVDKIKEKIGENKIKIEEKLVIEKKIANKMEEEEAKRKVKLVFGEDIRWAQIPCNCSILKLREIIGDKFPNFKGVLIKYRDEEGDLITITTSEELRWAEASTEHNFTRLYIVEVNPDQDIIILENVKKEENLPNNTCCINEWIVLFSHLFKNYVAFDSEAMEEMSTSEEAQEVFNVAAEKFKEMSALALFNWGNVHMSQARKKAEDTSRNAYDWAQNEYSLAGIRYEEALKIKPDFYEAILALGQKQFEQAKLSWYYHMNSNDDTEVIHLYNSAEENMEKGMQMWEEQKLIHMSKLDDISLAEQVQIYILWGTMLYERSIMEYKLGLPIWQDSLEVGIEKFQLAGASVTDITVMIKNHCSNDTTQEGLGFNIDEIIQAWSQMYEAKKWHSGISSNRLEPLLRRRVSKLYHHQEIPFLQEAINKLS